MQFFGFKIFYGLYDQIYRSFDWKPIGCFSALSMLIAYVPKYSEVQVDFEVREFFAKMKNLRMKFMNMFVNLAFA